MVCDELEPLASSFSDSQIGEILFALGDREPAIQDVNASFPVGEDDQLLKDALTEALGRDWSQRLRRAVYTRMVDSVNLHNDREFIEESGMHSVFVLICLDHDTESVQSVFKDSADGSELIFVGEDGQLQSREVVKGAVIAFDATQPHAYLHASGEEETILILDFHPVETEFLAF